MSRLRQTATVFAASLALTLPAVASAQDGGLPIGSTMPLALVQSLEGTPVALTKAIGNGPALVEFWAAWCENCEKLLPQLQAMESKYRGKLRFVGVAVSVNESVNRVRLHVARYNVPGVQLYDATGDATANWDVPATSHVVVIDKHGKVVYTGVGGDQDLEAAIKKAL